MSSILLNNHKIWDNEEDEILIEKIKNHKTYKEIAKDHNRSIDDVKSRFIKIYLLPNLLKCVDFEYIQNTLDIYENELKDHYIELLNTKENYINEYIIMKEFVLSLDNKVNDLYKKLDEILICIKK